MSDVCTECGCQPCRGSLCDGPAPKLPEGYWTNESGTELWCKTRGQAHPYCLANELSSGIIMTRAIYPQDRKAIAAFLQGLDE